MTNTPDTPAQLSDLMRSVEARITTLQHERQALVTRAARHSSDAERWLLAPVGRAEAPRGRPRTKDAIATAAKRPWAAQRVSGRRVAGHATSTSARGVLAATINRVRAAPDVRADPAPIPARS